MAGYIGRRLARCLLTLFIIATVVFLLLRQMPVEGYFQNYDKLTESQIADGLHQMGLDRPLPEQLLRFYRSLLRLDFGLSRVYRAGVPIDEILRPKIPVSLKLGTLSLLLSLLVGIPLGSIMARFKGRLPDRLGTLYIVLAEAVPAAVYFLLIELYGTRLLGLPLLYDGSPAALILPVFSLSIPSAAHYAMWLRRYMLDQATADYVLLARTKGESERRIFFSHILKNAFVPMIQYLPTSFLNTVVGSIYIESLYSIPGMGGLLVDVIKRQDNTMVEAIVLLFSAVGVAGLILGDLAMAALDPRIKLAKVGGGV